MCDVVRSTLSNGPKTWIVFIQKSPMKLGPSFAHNFSQRIATGLKLSTLLVQPSVQLLPPATLFQMGENVPANWSIVVSFLEFLRVISEIVKKSHPLKLSSRQIDSAFKMMQNDGTLVLTAAYFGIFTSLRKFWVLFSVRCGV